MWWNNPTSFNIGCMFNSTEKISVLLAKLARSKPQLKCREFSHVAVSNHRQHIWYVLGLLWLFFYRVTNRVGVYLEELIQLPQKYHLTCRDLNFCSTATKDYVWYVGKVRRNRWFLCNLRIILRADGCVWFMDVWCWSCLMRKDMFLYGTHWVENHFWISGYHNFW